MSNDELFERIKDRLSNIYGRRLQAVILYGSVARGQQEADSDIDILVLLSGPIDYWKEVKLIIRTLYPLMLETGHPIDAQPVDVDVYDAQEFPLYRNAKRDGVIA